MKLLFPNGEHGPVELETGRVLLGSSSDCRIVLLAPGIAIHHCEFQVADEAVRIKPSHPENNVTVNGKAITDVTPVKPGDLLTFAEVRCRAVAVEKSAPAPMRRDELADDDGATKVRVALPKFVLRGVSGETFGRIFPVGQTIVAGRQSECEIHIPSDGISRRHAELKLTADGVMVQDLGSANGTYINDRRVNRELLRPGDELRFDTVRFLLLAPGQQPSADRPAAGQTAATTAAASKPTASSGGRSPLLIGMIAVAVIAVVLVGLKLGGVF
ncbi:MAG: FHA domain-containing protein [Xanthomonadales bacterium]|nr:FHA domain-containing protein [Xanthomonadales bacterium]